MKPDTPRVPILIFIIIALLAGLGLGLAYSWMISPLKYVEASPSILRADFKEQYRAVIAAAYASSHDLERARARLALLGDPDPVQALSAQAQTMLASGESFMNAQMVAQLASDLQQGVVSIPPTSTPPSNLELSPTNPSIAAIPSGEVTSIATEVIETPQVFATLTPRPTHTPVPPPGKPFALVGQDTVCDKTLSEALLQVMLMDARRRQVPGIEIVVTWNGGEDSFFTGFKPEVGDGYADYQMEAGIVYSVRVVQGGATVPNVSIPNCTDTDGQSYLGGILLTFQQP
ncbi:MAG: hypothetical protein HZB19_09175 [Chloroflexi bacterium]|nr:hypothetical protein [Chloroflexota bacterium]